ncbi:MAG: hypothetical protein ABSE22_19700 [Xanthobacteraceae bacterium]|jgi:hypothetical protein
MSQAKDETTAVEPIERELIVAYLSYALDDVGAVSASGLQLLQLAIATIAKEAAAENPDQDAPTIFCH